jgi:hypothetical protein
MLSARRVVWVVGNAVAAVAMPAFFVLWLEWQTRGGEAFEPAAYSFATVAAAFTAAWWIFLGGLNVTVALFLWFRRQQ